MEGGILGLLSVAVNPLSLIPFFFNYSYSVFFLANLGIFLYFLFNEKSLRKHIREIWGKTPVYSKIFLACIIIAYVALCLYSMQPLNSIVPPTNEDVYQAEALRTGFRFTFNDCPHGLSVLLAFGRVMTGIGYAYLLTAYGIMLGIGNILLLYLLLRQYTKNPYHALLAPLLFVATDEVIYYSTTVSGTLIASSFFLLLLAYLFHHAKSQSGYRLLLHGTLLAVYFRIEATAVLAVVLLWGAYKYYHKTFKPKWWDYVLAYFFFLPHLYMHFNYRVFLNSHAQNYVLSMPNFAIKIGSFYSILSDFFPLLLIFMLAAGFIYLCYKSKYTVPAVLSSVFLVFLFLSLYPAMLMKHIYSLLPLMAAVICIGILAVAGLFRKKLFQGAVIAFFAGFILLHTGPYQQYELDNVYIQPNIGAAEKYRGQEIVLFGYRDIVFSYQGLYDDPSIANDVIDPFDTPPDLDSLPHHDYLIHLTELDSDVNNIKERLGIDVEFIENDGIVTVYRIIG